MQKLMSDLIDFQSERDWKKFHTPENLAKSISIEAAELLEHFQWGKEYDEGEVADELADVLIYCIYMADAMDYDWEVIHTQCKQSKVGHVYGRFKKKGTSNWFTRDIACIADESRYCVWCEVPNGGTLLAKNPSWFINNRNR